MLVKRKEKRCYYGVWNWLESAIVVASRVKAEWRCNYAKRLNGDGSGSPVAGELLFRP
jgi:hypothetical protein